MKPNRKNKAPISHGVVLNFRTHGTEQDLTHTAHGRFNWSITKAPFGRMTSHGWKGYIVKQGTQIAFKCNWLRDFKPTIRHLEQTFSGDKETSNEFYDITKTGDIWAFNTRLFTKETINTLEGIIMHKVPMGTDIPSRKLSKRDRERRLTRSKKLKALKDTK